MKKLLPLFLCSLLASCSTYWEADSSTNEAGINARVVYTRQQYTHKEKLRVFVTDKNGNKVATHDIKYSYDSLPSSYPRFEVDHRFQGNILKIKLVDERERVIRIIKVDIHKGELSPPPLPISPTTPSN